MARARGAAARVRGGRGSYAFASGPGAGRALFVAGRPLPAPGRPLLTAGRPLPAARRALVASLAVFLLCAASPATSFGQAGGTGGVAAGPEGASAPLSRTPGTLRSPDTARSRRPGRARARPRRTAPARPPVRSRVTLTRLRCLSRCGAAGAVRPGALLRVRGAGLARADEVRFAGAPGTADDVAAAPRVRRRTSVDVRVPLAAVSGPVGVVDRDGVASAAAPAPLTVEAPPPGRGPSIEVDVQSPKAYFDAARPVRVSYVVHDQRPVEVRIELVRVADGTVVQTWMPGLVAPELPGVVEWDGRSGRRAPRPGRYSFRVTAAAADGALRASSVQSAPPAAAPRPDPSAFLFLGHQFPVRGPHGYGESAARFGGGRGHKGQDVFAACGTPVVAARGGTVRFKQYQAAAGHYVVIDGAGTGVDHAYMHLREPALVDAGERVRTGQLIGHVGRTGDASACHLHFEMWSAPGWYRGGSAFDPLPSLLAWDKAA